MTPREVLMLFLQGLKLNAEADIATGNDILDLEFRQQGLTIFVLAFAHFGYGLFENPGSLERILF